MKKILIVEDEKAIREFIEKSFQISGCTTLCAKDGIEGLEIFKSENGIDMIILDVMLPGIDGFSVCQKIREIDDTTGIIMLTAKSQEEDKINGLTFGADDYIVKPFSPKELIARANSLYRKVSIMKNKTLKKIEREIKDGYLNIFFDEKMVIKDSKDVKLTNTEFEVVSLLVQNKGKTITRDYMLDKIWGSSYIGSYKTIDVNILRIRKKLDLDSEKYIKTVRGRGYQWKDL